MFIGFVSKGGEDWGTITGDSIESVCDIFSEVYGDDWSLDSIEERD